MGLTTIGWREWVSLPQLGVDAVKAKIDTGARSSTLHAWDVDVVDRPGGPLVRFVAHPRQHDLSLTVITTAELVEWRDARSSNGSVAAFRQLDANILVQEYIKEAGGADIRAFVVGNRVVAAMRRQSAPGEFRSNLHRGRHRREDPAHARGATVAVRAARTLGLNVSGVDLVRSNHGPLVLEVNSSPGLEGIEATSGVDVASRIVEWIEKSHAARPRRRRTKA
jgi:hypothetical protein